MRPKLLTFNLWFLIFTFYFLLFPVHSFADPQVDAIQSTYRSIQDFQADFMQNTYVEILGSTIKETGIFMIKKPGMLRIDYTGEHPKRYLSNGKKIWIVDKDLQQVETYNVTANSIPKEALEFLKGFGDMEKLFTVSHWKVSKPIKDHTYLKLIPKSASEQYKWLDCDFGTDNLLKTMVIHNKSGNVSTYTFTNIKINTGLTNDLFVFKP